MSSKGGTGAAHRPRREGAERRPRATADGPRIVCATALLPGAACRSKMPADMARVTWRSRPYLVAAGIILALGVAIQVWLACRGTVGGDQRILLDLGLDYARTGHLEPVAKTSSGGGSVPGALLQLVIGLPLRVWQDPRSPVALAGLFHLVAGIVLARTLTQAAGGRQAVFFLAVWWLSPWRLYHSGFLWEPAYLVLPAAVHLWASWRLRENARFIPSAVLAATLLLTFQIHMSAMLLLVLTAILVARRLVRLSWAGAAAGAVAGAIPLAPTLRAALAGTLPPLMPTDGYFGYGLVKIYPVLRGLAYWFRLGSPDIGRRLAQVVFLDPAWAGADAWRTGVRVAVLVLAWLAMASVALAVVASWSWLRQGRGSAAGSAAGTTGTGTGATGTTGGDRASDPGRQWLRRYSLAAFAALLAAAALSPVTVQGWHVLVALPAACLPVSFWLADHWASRRLVVRCVVVAFLLLRIPVIAVIGLGHEAYGGKVPAEAPVAAQSAD